MHPSLFATHLSKRLLTFLQAEAHISGVIVRQIFVMAALSCGISSGFLSLIFHFLENNFQLNKLFVLLCISFSQMRP